MFIIKLMGGIGNQLFQLNFYNYLKEKFPKAKIRVNLSYYDEDSRHGGYMLNACKLKKIKFFMSSHYRLINDKNYLEDFSDKDNILFEGYWQDMRFFTENKLQFSSAFKGVLNLDAQNIFNLINNTSNPVSIHVRCGDYDNDMHLGNVSTKAYYNNAVEEITKLIANPVFFVFSNNIEWTKNNVNFFNFPVYFVTCNSEPDDAKWDLFLMSKCHYNIISNSSFSWWAQYFNEFTEKKVITPPYWVNEPSSCFTQAIPNIQQLNYMSIVSNLPIGKKRIENIKFSCILFLENDISTIRRHAATLLNQTFDCVELFVIVNKNKIENSHFINLFKQNQNIHFLETNNINTILKSVNGNYIVFLNNESYFMNNAFESINKYLNNNKCDMLEFNYIQRPLNYKIIKNDKKSDLNFLFNKVFSFNFLNNCCKKDEIKNIKELIEILKTNIIETLSISDCLLNVIINKSINQNASKNIIYYFKKFFKTLLSPN